jgi:hypothetical protein
VTQRDLHAKFSEATVRLCDVLRAYNRGGLRTPQQRAELRAAETEWDRAFDALYGAGDHLPAPPHFAHAVPDRFGPLVLGRDRDA